jgi:hypothetical protein
MDCLALAANAHVRGKDRLSMDCLAPATNTYVLPDHAQ